MKQKNGRLVYSTESGRICPDCNHPKAACSCRKTQSNQKPPSLPEHPLDGVVRLHRQSKGRKGKVVTLIEGLDVQSPDMPSLIKELKNRCGAGGKIEGKVILIQGDKRDVLKPLLLEKGFQVKIAGG